jgi:hypothetical protein
MFAEGMVALATIGIQASDSKTVFDRPPVSLIITNFVLIKY